MAGRTLLSLFLLGLLCFSQCAVDGVTLRQSRNMIRGRPVGGLLKRPPPAAVVGKASTFAQFDSLIDHFNTSDTRTYKQSYWYNDQYYKTGGPAFLMLGGESAEDSSWLDIPTLAWVKMAIDNGAFMFVLEHRFYGNSRPKPNMATPNLIYLSSAQAIEDMAGFIKGMKAKFPQLSNAPWVTFGGSYSGALSAWARQKHPELVHYAVASSGPVQAELDFIEYMEVVQASIGSRSRGSAQCADSVRDSMSQVALLLNTANGRAQLRNTFNLCSDINQTDAKSVQMFWETVYSPYMEIVQYSNDNAGLFNTFLTIGNGICRYHETNDTSLTKLQKVNQMFDKSIGFNTCNSIDYSDLIEYMQNTQYEYAGSDRAWVWQTCTEFGYYQSTDSPYAGPFFGGQGSVPVSFYIQQCNDIFGAAYTSQAVANAVNKTNAYYGGRDRFTGDHVLMPNGDIDPWHALGKLDSGDKTVVPIMIYGSAHCADMYAPANTDLSSLTNARKQIAQQLSTWLNSSNSISLLFSVLFVCMHLVQY